MTGTRLGCVWSAVFHRRFDWHDDTKLLELAQYRAHKSNMDSLMTVNELARYMRVHPTTIYRLLKSGGVPAIKVGGSWRFHRGAIDRWVKGIETGDLPAPRGSGASR
jgi:excisionase family DNA binding protein